jgi:hypothetical protein
MVFVGGCHCGNLRVRFETDIAPERIEVRACQCSFCRRHGSSAATDPNGRLTVEFDDAALVSRYVFGLRTSEFLVCRRCGVYVAAVMREGDRAWGTVNLEALEDRTRFGMPVQVSYAAEDAAAVSPAGRSAGHPRPCRPSSSYRRGPTGEPRVVHVDQELDYKITFVAPTFESFVRGLQGDEQFDGA